MANDNTDQWLGEVFPDRVPERIRSTRQVTFTQSYDPEDDTPPVAADGVSYGLSRFLTDTRSVSRTVLVVAAEASTLVVLLVVLYRAVSWLT